MSTQNIASQVDEDAQKPLDLHDLFRMQAVSGHDCSVTLPPYAIQSLMAHLRGVSAVTAVLTASMDKDAIQLSDWMNGGLLDAVRTLTEGASDILYKADERAKKGGAA